MSDNFKKVRAVLWAILIANFGVAILKVVIGSAIKSTSMTADGFHSLTDGSSNIVGIVGVWFASKPVDDDHPYGHKKFETLAGLFIGGMLFFISFKIFTDAFTRFFNPVRPEVTVESLVTIVATVVVNIFVSTYEYRQGRKLGSDILVSDSIHTRSDIFVSLGVLFTLICIKMGLPAIIDPIVSLVVAGFIIHAALEIFHAASGVLVDRNAVEIEKIREVVMEFPQVRDAYNIRSRGREDDIHIDLHIMTDPGMSIEEAHTLIHDIEEKMRESISPSI